MGRQKTGKKTGQKFRKQLQREKNKYKIIKDRKIINGKISILYNRQEEFVVYQRDIGSSYHARDLFGVEYIVFPNFDGWYPIERLDGSWYRRISYRIYRNRTQGQESLKQAFNNSRYHSEEQKITVRYSSIPKRHHTQSMNAEMTSRFEETLSASKYVERMKERVCNINYDWCHLASHGLGGSDDPNNIVAGTTHCNSEQLIIEKAIYKYKNENRFFSIRVQSSINKCNDKRFVGEVIKYEILDINDEACFTWYINCRRRWKPTKDEQFSLEKKVYKAMNLSLQKIYHVEDDIKERVIDYIDRVNPLEDYEEYI